MTAAWRPSASERSAAFIGVVVLGPVIGSRFVRIVGAPVAMFRGMTGVLARDNASRNPKRTAATASALMIGVALVVLISVFATSARSSIDANIDSHLKSDWIVSPLQQDGLSPTVAQAVDALPETASVTSFRMAPATLDGGTVQITGIDPANVEQHLDLDVKAGAVERARRTRARCPGADGEGARVEGRRRRHGRRSRRLVHSTSPSA